MARSAPRPDSAARRRLRAGEALVLITLFRGVLRLVPFALVMRALGPMVPAAPASPLPPEQATAAQAVVAALRTATRRVPRPRQCLAVALAARAMLTRRGLASTLTIGARRSADRPLDLHAWLDAGDMPVCGYPLDAALAVLGSFVSGHATGD